MTKAEQLIRVEMFNAWEFLGDGLARAALRFLMLEELEREIKASQNISASRVGFYKAKLRDLAHELESNRKMAIAWESAKLGHHPFNQRDLGDAIKTHGNDFEYHLCFLFRNDGFSAVVEFVREHLWAPAHERMIEQLKRKSRRLGKSFVKSHPQPQPQNPENP